MHVVLAVMVILITFFTVSMMMVMFVTVVIRAFHEQRFHAGKCGNRNLFFARDLFCRLLHKRFHFWSNPDH